MFGKNTGFKAQSAMEYLMTYGWAILIIAVVLAALFSLGVFSGGNLLGNSCVASPGYSCQTATLSPQGTYDTLGLTLGQNTGSTVYNIQMACAATTTSGGLPSTSGTATANVNGNGFGNVLSTGVIAIGANSATQLVSGQTITIPTNALGLPCWTSTATALTAAASPVGTSFSGYLWLNYTTGSGAPSGTNPYLTIKIATITTKVV